MIGGALARRPSLRFVLTWETDANDMDLLVTDAYGDEANGWDRHMPSGGRHDHNVVNGYGPECFTIEGSPRAAPYKLQVRYQRRGSMGHGIGKVQILRHDGKGRLRFDDRPFLMMKRATIELGSVSL